jgi:hypothetical protein
MLIDACKVNSMQKDDAMRISFAVVCGARRTDASLAAGGRRWFVREEIGQRDRLASIVVPRVSTADASAVRPGERTERAAHVC